MHLQLLTLLDGLEKSEKAVITSGKGFQTSQAIVLPIPANEEVVSHPIMAWKKGKAFAFSGPKLTNGPVLTDNVCRHQTQSTILLW